MPERWQTAFMEGTASTENPVRTVESLPKAHLHLHFTGSMRPSTLKDLAAKHGIRLPESLRDQHMLRLTPDERGWFRFQRLYYAARNCVRDADDMRRIVLEAAQDDAAEGSGWLEMQVDPTSYAPHVGGLTNALDLYVATISERCGMRMSTAVPPKRSMGMISIEIGSARVGS